MSCYFTRTLSSRGNTDASFAAYLKLQFGKMSGQGSMGAKSAKDMDDLPTQSRNKLPDHLELQRTRVVCKADAPTHTEGFQYSGAFAAMGVDNSVSVEKFCNDFKIKINRLTEDDMEFDMIGVDASIANAFRRILIAEVPTMTIEKVLMVDNTSVIADEVLSHRLGLIPLDADPRLFDYISDDVPNERNTIVYKLHVSCEKGSQRLTVKSGQLEWLPEGSQLTIASPALSGDKQKTYTSFGQSQQKTYERPLGVKYEDITIARLGPGQVINLYVKIVEGSRRGQLPTYLEGVNCKSADVPSPSRPISI